MPINHKHKLLFLHIPKTAGNSIKQFFSFSNKEISEDNYHGTLDYLVKKYYQYQDYYLFTIVRNPWDRFASAFFYAKMDKSMYHDKDNETKHPDYDIVKDLSFNECVELFYHKKIELVEKHFHPMVKWIDNDIKIKKIIRFENLHKELKELCKESNLCLNIDSFPIINKSDKKQKYQDIYNKETKQMIAEIYEQDIKNSFILFNFFTKAQEIQYFLGFLFLLFL